MPVNNGDGIHKDVLSWSTSELSAPPALGSSFTGTGAPDLMAFKDDEGVVQPGDLVSGDQTTAEPNQTLEGQEFKDNPGTTDVFEFEIPSQVTDGVNTFNVYQIHNDACGGMATGHVDDDDNRVDGNDGDNDVIVGERGGDTVIAERWKRIRHCSQTGKGANTGSRDILNFKKKQAKRQQLGHLQPTPRCPEWRNQLMQFEQGQV